MGQGSSSRLQLSGIEGDTEQKTGISQNSPEMNVEIQVARSKSAV